MLQANTILLPRLVLLIELLTHWLINERRLSNYTKSNGGLSRMIEYRLCELETVAYFKEKNRIFQEIMRKTTKTLHHDELYVDQDSNPRPP